MDNVSSVIFNDVVSNTQICYHLVYPKNFNLMKKLRRASQASGQNTLKKRRRRGRPRKEETKKNEDERRPSEEIVNGDKTDDSIVQIPCSRTRYGRVTRPPKHMSKFVDTRVSMTADVNINTNMIDIVEPQHNFNSEQHVRKPLLGSTEEKTILPKKIRKNVDRFTCGVCKKV